LNRISPPDAPRDWDSYVNVCNFYCYSPPPVKLFFSLFYLKDGIYLTCKRFRANKGVRDRFWPAASAEGLLLLGSGPER